MKYIHFLVLHLKQRDIFKVNLYLGDSGWTEKEVLDNYGNDFQRGGIDQYTFNSNDIGTVRCAEIYIDGYDKFLISKACVHCTMI